ncbi:M12 family metallopeptidase [Aquabacterium sp. OR-4]|uniref:M12 family metallopeptidase n=1 Tax=Aquabacterium sp. OR-4 TaxID=2978127 RepID=UPI0021B33DEF|nr:M12 family metallopeptidase [Aquabacterium sp. OR-4]MDT7838221.1 M12 family metallopeptidase [Aquabacterium sp. OR-4]
MASRKTAATGRATIGRADGGPLRLRHYCSMREAAPRTFKPGVAANRMRAIIVNDRKWVNGSTLRYAFFENRPGLAHLAGTEAQKKVFRDGLKAWVDLGIGLKFEEVPKRADAQLRIAFQRNDGHWSYIGRDVLDQGIDAATMNLDPTAGNFDWETAAHEIGHSMGLPHEHQNPKAGIVWNEEAVYAALAQPPNEWPREVTFHNIIRKINADTVQGSNWDKDSVMHYPFEAGLIESPPIYQVQPLQPAGGLSARDREWIRSFYPPLTAAAEPELPMLTARRFDVPAGGQINMLLKPKSSRYYRMQTFGDADVVAALFERTATEDLYLTADDDSGEERNALIRQRLHKGRTYVLRIRLYHASDMGETAVMWW